MADDENRRFTDKFALRLPAGLRDQLGRAAVANNRSTNAEIVARLEQSLREDVREPLQSQIDKLKGEMDTLRRRFREVKP